MGIAIGGPDIKLDGAAIAQQFLIWLPLMRIIEHHDGMHIAPARQLAQRVIHEQAAAMRRGTDRIG